MVSLMATNASDSCFRQTTLTGTRQGYFTHLGEGRKGLELELGYSVGG